MVNKGDICLVSSDPNFSFTLPEDELWEEIDDRLWMSQLEKSPHFHEDNLEVECNWENPLEYHEVARLVLINEVKEGKAKVTLLDQASNEWEFNSEAMSPFDIHLGAATTGLPHSFIVETDLTFDVLDHQLSRPVLTIPEAIYAKIEDFLDGKHVEDLNIGSSNDNIWKKSDFYDVEQLSKLSESTHD